MEDDIESELDEDLNEENFDVDDGIDEEFKEGNAQKFISTQEVIDHIEKTWRKETELLNLVYGKFEPLEKSTPFVT